MRNVKTVAVGSGDSISAAPWQWQVSERTLIIQLGAIGRTLSWASLGGGIRLADTIINHQVATDDRYAVDHPRRYLAEVAQRLGLNPRMTAGMMTGADVHRVAFTIKREADLIVAAWCTAGCSNALRVGDPARVSIEAGTINLAVAINRRLTSAAMVEALAIATEARTAAVLDAGILSSLSHRPATGTGTDCTVVASLAYGGAAQYCGKHTLIGELIGNAVLGSCAQALRPMERLSGD